MLCACGWARLFLHQLRCLIITRTLGDNDYDLQLTYRAQTGDSLKVMEPADSRLGSEHQPFPASTAFLWEAGACGESSIHACPFPSSGASRKAQGTIPLSSSSETSWRCFCLHVALTGGPCTGAGESWLVPSEAQRLKPECPWEWPPSLL